MKDINISIGLMVFNWTCLKQLFVFSLWCFLAVWDVIFWKGVFSAELRSVLSPCRHVCSCSVTAPGTSWAAGDLFELEWFSYHNDTTMLLNPWIRLHKEWVDFIFYKCSRLQDRTSNCQGLLQIIYKWNIIINIINNYFGFLSLICAPIHS